MADDLHPRIRRLIAGDDQARTSLQALAGPGSDRLLARAAATATTTRDRQLVAIAAAHLAGDEDRLDALVRDHLADHPGSLLAAWIAAQHPSRPS
jgi:hypothetical protein